MGFWAEIKHALNSTVGTKEFEPLDEQIRNNKVLMASEELYATVSTGFSLNVNSGPSNPHVDIVTRSIKMKNKGSCKIMIDGLFVGGGKLIVQIKKNGTFLLNNSIDMAGPSSLKLDAITFDRGDVLTFRFYVDGTNLDKDKTIAYSASDAKILGTFKESVFSYI